MLIGIEAVNVVAGYQSVVQACGSQARQELSSLRLQRNLQAAPD